MRNDSKELEVHLSENIFLILSSSDQKRFLKKYQRLAAQLYENEEKKSELNKLLLFPQLQFDGNNCDIETKKIIRLKNHAENEEKDQTHSLLRQAFYQAAFDMYRSRVINQKNDFLLEKLPAIASSLNVRHISSYAAQHKTKSSREKEYAACRLHYLRKKEPVAREEVMQFIRLADFLKLPRDLSGFNLTGCDLTGLDLRKCNFSDSIMTDVKINDKTRLKGSLFNGIKSSSIKINGELSRAPSLLFSTITDKYAENRKEKIKSIEKKVGGWFASKASFFMSNYIAKFDSLDLNNNTEKNPSALLEFIAHSETGKRSRSIWKSILNEKIPERLELDQSSETRLPDDKIQTTITANPDLGLL